MAVHWKNSALQGKPQKCQTKEPQEHGIKENAPLVRVPGNKTMERRDHQHRNEKSWD
jgi:hypothetical protein